MAMTAAQELQRVIFGGSRSDLVHEWAGVWVVAERLSGNCYRGVSHGKPLVYSTREVKTRHGGGNGYGQTSISHVREESGEYVGYRGEDVSGTLGQVAEGGCWYATEAQAKSAAQRWKIIGGKGQRRLAVAV